MYSKELGANSKVDAVSLEQLSVSNLKNSKSPIDTQTLRLNDAMTQRPNDPVDSIDSMTQRPNRLNDLSTLLFSKQTR